MSVDEKKAVDEAKAQIKLYRTRIARLKVLEHGRQEPFWAALREEIKLAGETNDRLKDTAIAKDDIRDVAVEFAAIKSYGRASLAYKGIIQNVDQAETKADHLNERIAELNRFIEGVEKGKGADKRQGVV